MAPDFHEEDIVFIDPERDMKHKSFVIVQIPGKDTPILRQLFIERVKNPQNNQPNDRSTYHAGSYKTHFLGTVFGKCRLY